MIFKRFEVYFFARKKSKAREKLAKIKFRVFNYQVITLLA